MVRGVRPLSSVPSLLGGPEGPESFASFVDRLAAHQLVPVPITTLLSLNSRPAGKGGKLPRTERNEQARQKAAQLDREVQLGADAPAPLPPTPPPPPPHTAALNLADLTSGVHTVNLDDDINPWKLMDDLDDLDGTEEET